jgi:hypothetical protein
MDLRPLHCSTAKTHLAIRSSLVMAEEILMSLVNDTVWIRMSSNTIAYANYYEHRQEKQEQATWLLKNISRVQE